MSKLKSVAELEALRAKGLAERKVDRPCLTVCTGSGCKAAGADDVVTALRERIKGSGLDGEVDVKATGCHGFCQQAPVMLVWPEGVFYNKVSVADVKAIVSSVTDGHHPVEKLLYRDPAGGDSVLKAEDVPFFKRQKRVLFANHWHIDPLNIGDYLAVGGYQALVKVLMHLHPEDIVQIITRSGLRGRGGAGFPTGIKWDACRKNPVTPHYVICNADEGDPGAFMDGSLLEGNPHSMLE